VWDAKDLGYRGTNVSTKSSTAGPNRLNPLFSKHLRLLSAPAHPTTAPCYPDCSQFRMNGLEVDWDRLTATDDACAAPCDHMPRVMEGEMKLKRFTTVPACPAAKEPVIIGQRQRHTRVIRARAKAMRAVDLFCGAGGSSWGARNAGAEIVAGFDKWEAACEAYHQNFPGARVYRTALEDLNPRQLVRALGKVDLILASPECRSHSPARGKQPGSRKSRETAFEVVRFARVLEPRWVVVENVVSMRNWAGYREFMVQLAKLGYRVSAQTLVATDFGVPQKRKRLFLLCDRQQYPPVITGNRDGLLCAQNIIEQNGRYSFSPLRTARRARATIERAGRAIAALGSHEPFLLVYYGSDHAGGWQRLDEPLRTITTLDRFAYVRPCASGHEMRMLQPPELKAAMGMPPEFSLGNGTRRTRVKLVGNAVCPPVMEAIVRTLTARSSRGGKTC